MRISKTGLAIVSIWLLSTWLISTSIFSVITPKEIDLSTSLECPHATSEECLTKETKPKAREEIKESFVSSLHATQKATSIFSFPLGILEFEEVIENRASRIELHVSSPKLEKVVLPNAQIVCRFSGKTFNLKSGSRYHTGNFLQLFTFVGLDSDSAIENVGKVAESVINDYEGCTWIPEDITFVSGSERVVAGPNETVSLVSILKPYLVFTPVWSTSILIYFGVFALLGALIVLIRQFIEILTRGTGYFLGDGRVVYMENYLEEMRKLCTCGHARSLHNHTFSRIPAGSPVPDGKKDAECKASRCECQQYDSQEEAESLAEIPK